jgi:predicted Rossmann-fold nucleotide-binding protein
MHPPSKVQGLCQKAAIGAVGTMEETMRVLTLTELMRLTRTELFALAARMTTALLEFPEGSYERATAHVNLWNIRQVPARRDFSP